MAFLQGFAASKKAGSEMTGFETLLVFLAFAVVSIALALAAYGPESFRVHAPAWHRSAVKD